MIESILEPVEAKNKEMRRVSVEIIDLDWIFKGENFMIFLRILSDLDDGEILLQKSIRSFVSLLWKDVKNQIYWQSFYPFLRYLILMQVLSSYVSK